MILIIKKNWRLDWLHSLVELSNPEFQQRYLDRRIGVPAWTFIEYMNSYFDDLRLSDLGYDYYLKKGYIKEEEYNCIKEFHKLLDEYEAPVSDYDPVSIVKDPIWLNIRTLGQQSVENLKLLIDDPEEVKVFSSTLPPVSDGCFTWPNPPTKFRVFVAKHT